MQLQLSLADLINDLLNNANQAPDNDNSNNPIDMNVVVEMAVENIADGAEGQNGENEFDKNELGNDENRTEDMMILILLLEQPKDIHILDVFLLRM